MALAAGGTGTMAAATSGGSLSVQQTMPQLNPDFPSFDGPEFNTGLPGFQLPPMGPVFGLDSSISPGTADPSCLTVDIGYSHLHAATWDKKLAKASPLQVPTKRVPSDSPDPLPSGDQTVANGLPVVVALEKGAAIRKWLRKAPRKRLLQGPPASVALGDVSGDESSLSFRPMQFLGLPNKEAVRGDATPLVLKNLNSDELMEDAANGSGMCVQLICTAMSEGPGVPIEDPNTEVRVQPEEALALVVAHVARQAARPVPPTAAARRSQTTGDRDKMILPSTGTIVVPGSSSTRARHALAAAMEEAGMEMLRMLPFSAAAVVGALARKDPALCKSVQSDEDKSVLVVHVSDAAFDVAVVTCATSPDQAPSSQELCGFSHFRVAACAGGQQLDKADVEGAALTAVKQMCTSNMSSPKVALVYGVDQVSVAGKLQETLPSLAEVVCGEAADGALGGCYVSVAEGPNPNRIRAVQVQDIVAHAVGLQVGPEDVDAAGREVRPAFAAGQALPCEFDCVLEAAADGGSQVTLVQQLQGQKQWEDLRPATRPLAYHDEDVDEELIMERVVLRLKMNADGLLTSTLAEQGKPTEESRSQVSKKKFQQKLRRTIFTLLLTLMMVLGPMGYMLQDMYNASQAAVAKRAEHVLRLENYYAEVAPEKLDEGGIKMLEDVLDKYKDKEHKLWLQLEKKYGVFPKVPSKESKQKLRKAKRSGKEEKEL